MYIHIIANTTIGSRITNWLIIAVQTGSTRAGYPPNFHCENLTSEIS
jgi:hypothetical protein